MKQFILKAIRVQESKELEKAEAIKELKRVIERRFREKFVSKLTLRRSRIVSKGDFNLFR